MKKQRFLFMILLSLPALADAPPSAEFWEYMNEFGDDADEVFDAIDYSVAVVTKRTDVEPQMKVEENDPNELKTSVHSKKSEEE